jgi:hypothetical protein
MSEQGAAPLHGCPKAVSAPELQDIDLKVQIPVRMRYDYGMVPERGRRRAIVYGFREPAYIRNELRPVLESLTSGR